jgi:hypothetical protein
VQNRAQKLWVAKLHISDSTAEKIVSKHHIQPHDVRDAVECQVGLAYEWNYHPERGWRAYVKTHVGGRYTFLVLYPAFDHSGDCWRLGSAYPIAPAR